MRAITGQENAALNAQDGHTVHVRVLVWNGAGYQNVCALEGRNWLVSVEWDESINEPCAQATVTLRRSLEDYSLNPLVSNKLTGLLALARPFVIETATVPLGDPAEESDFREVFHGIVETLALDKDPISFTGRDMAGPLLRDYIETEAEYGSDAGTPVESIIQSILTDNDTGVTLYVRNVSGGSTTGAVFGRFKVKKAAVLTTVREIALKIGWDLRYLWHDSPGEWRFTLIEPDRAATSSDWTFQPHKVKAVTKLSQTLFDIRNVGRLYYYNRSDLDAAGKAKLAFVTAQDNASIATYQRQYIQLAESEDSPVDSAAEAQVMINAAIADLKEPLLDFGVDVGFHYAVQLGDMLTFAADGLNFSSPQTLAVVSARHRIYGRGHRTSLELRGKPVGANDAWLARDGRVKVLAQPPASAPDPVGGLTATATAGGAVLTFAAPVTPPVPVEFELHVDTASDFTPTLSTLREKGARTNFEVTGLAPGVTYYAQVVGRDRVGNRSPAVQVSFSPRYVEPRTLQPRIAYGTLPPNADFEAHSDASVPPDAWTLIAGAWGTDVQATTTTYSGSTGLFIPSGSVFGVTCQLMAVRGGVRYATRVAYMVPGATDPGITVTLRFFDVVGGAMTGSAFSGLTATSGAWTTLELHGTSPTTARYCDVLIHASAPTPAAANIDSAEFNRASLPQQVWRGVGPGTGTPWENSWSNFGGVFETVGYRINSLGNLELKGLAKAPSPAPAAYANIFTLPSEYRPAATKLFRVNTSAGAADLEIAASGTVKLQSITANAYLPLDGLSFPLA